MREAGAARAWVLAFVLLAGGGLGLFVGVGCAIGANACPFRSSPAQHSTDGMTLFESTCAACHGPQGTGGRTQGINAPSLVTGEGGALDDAQLIDKISNGKPFQGMPMYKHTFSQLQIRAIALFVQSLRSSPSPSPSPSPSGSPS